MTSSAPAPLDGATTAETPDTAPPAKRPRGRPRKDRSNEPPKIKRPRGRPRKDPAAEAERLATLAKAEYDKTEAAYRRATDPIPAVQHAGKRKKAASGKKSRLKTAIERWRQPGFAGFDAWQQDVKPLIPSERGGRIVYTYPNEIVREEIRAALDGGHGTIILCWPRRHGKTVAAALLILHRLMTRGHQTAALVANSRQQASDTCFAALTGIIRHTPATKELITRGEIVIAATKIEFVTAASTVTLYPSNAAALFGKKLSIAQISELHAADDDETYQTLASATVDTRDSLVLVDSTVGNRASPLYSLYSIAQAKADPTLYFSHVQYANLEDAIANGPGWIPADRLRSRAAQMLPGVFAQQHLNRWGDGENQLFSEAILKRCTTEAYPLDVAALAGGAGYVVTAGLDRAYGFSLHGDATVTTCVLKINRDGEDHFYVLASDAIAFSTAGGIKSALSRYHKDYGLKFAALESYNSQDISAWAADQAFEHETVHPTAERQANAFAAMYQAAAEDRLHIHPSFKKLIAELGIITYTTDTAKGSSAAPVPKFSAPPKQKDDHAYSLLWAVYASRNTELNPFELKGISCEAAGPVARLCILNGGEIIPACQDTCRSFHNFNKLYADYTAQQRNATPLPAANFFRIKVKNTGAHVLRR